nr:RNA-dependent RNA polymerase [Drosophila biauraria male killing partitivirus 1]
MKYLGKASGFGQRFEPPSPSPYLKFLAPLTGDYQRSPVTLAGIRDDIKKNISTNARRPATPLFDEAIRRTFRAFQLPDRIPMLHLNDVFQKDLPIWSSSAGLPWMNLGYKNKGEIRKDPDAIQRVRWFWHRVKAGESIRLPDCCAYVRAHIVKTGETKVRAVWGYPATVTFGEAVFALPLINAYKSGRYPIAYGYETGLGGCKKVLHEFKGKNFLGIDFKNFDKTLPDWLIEIAFDVLAYNIDFSKYEEHGTARVEAMLRMFSILKNYCIKTKIRMCNGERYQKRWGLASGSYFTQLVGSICNYLLLTYACLKYSVHINKILVFGDDSLIGTDALLTPDDIAMALEPLGMTVNVSKSGHSAYLGRLTFLGYSINDGVPTRGRDKTMASLVWPERHDKDWIFAASRAHGIAFANMGVDLLVDYWCRRICSYLPYKLQLSRDQQRHLEILGFSSIPDKIPNCYEFMRRLGFC